MRFYGFMYVLNSADASRDKLFEEINKISVDLIIFDKTQLATVIF
jgi:hypothetical protein